MHFATLAFPDLFPARKGFRLACHSVSHVPSCSRIVEVKTTNFYYYLIFIVLFDLYFVYNFYSIFIILVLIKVSALPGRFRLVPGRFQAVPGGSGRLR